MKFLKNLFSIIAVALLISTLVACNAESTTSNQTTTTTSQIVLTIGENTMDLKVGEEKVLIYQTNDQTGVTFESNNTEVVTVDDTGKVKAIGLGNAVITIKTKSNIEIKVEVNVKVNKPDPLYIIVKGESFVEQGKTISLTATPKPVDTNEEVVWSSRNEDVATVDPTGNVTGVSVGKTVIIATSKSKATVKGEFAITIIEPIPIILRIGDITSPIVIGDEVPLQLTITPKAEENREVVWSTDNTSIATVSQSGLLTAVGEGVVTVKVEIVDDPTLYTIKKLNIFESLSTDTVMNLLNLEQRLNLDYYKFTATGYTHEYQHSTYRSVSNYYFGEIEVIQQLIPVGNNNRPGKMSALPAGVTPYNDDNIYWIVIHDTGNSLPTATAKMHANYVQRADTATSWHYTVDDQEIYQHIPDEERAYHAGDGSNLVGQGNYLGGGNRNGIGIEMAINEGSDIFATWQRTAKLAAQLLVKHNLPLDHVKYHIDFSGKICPQTLINAKLIPVFEQMVAIEYEMAKNFGDADITMRSLNPEYLDNTGRIIKFPSAPMVVSYEVTIIKDGKTEVRVFDSYLEPSNY